MSEIGTARLMQHFNDACKEYNETHSEIVLGMLLGIQRAYICLVPMDENYIYIENSINDILKNRNVMGR